MAKKITHQKYFVLVSYQGREYIKFDVINDHEYKEFFDTAEEAVESLTDTVALDLDHYSDGYEFKIAAITDEVITVKLSKDFTLEIQ